MLLWELNPSASELVIKWSDGTETRADVAHPFVTSNGVNLAIASVVYPRAGLAAAVTVLDATSNVIGVRAFSAEYLAPSLPKPS